MTAFRVFPNAQTLARGVVDRVVFLLRQRLRVSFRVTLVLSGGRTAEGVFRAFAQSKTARQIPWSRVHVFWADERHVPLDHPDSNFALAHRLWLHRGPLPPQNLHPFFKKPGKLQADARSFDRTLHRWLGKKPWDVVLLGMGEDGHTASLFPDRKVLRGRRRWVEPIFDSPKPPLRRLTLTLTALNRTRHVLFVVSGKKKRESLRLCISKTKCDLPAGQIRPRGGTVEWCVDRAAWPNPLSPVK